MWMRRSDNLLANMHDCPIPTSTYFDHDIICGLHGCTPLFCRACLRGGKAARRRGGKAAKRSKSGNEALRQHCARHFNVERIVLKAIRPFFFLL